MRSDLLKRFMNFNEDVQCGQNYLEYGIISNSLRVSIMYSVQFLEFLFNLKVDSPVDGLLGFMYFNTRVIIEVSGKL